MGGSPLWRVLMIFDYLSSNWRQISNFAKVGIAGNLFGWLIYFSIYQLLPIETYKPTIAWAISFHFGILIQHTLHRRFTFTEDSSYYLISLYRTYISYMANFIICLFSNIFFNEFLEIYHHISWLLTLIISIPISFVMLKYYAFKIDQK